MTGSIPDTIRIEDEVDATITALLDVENSFVIEKAYDGDIGVEIADSTGVNIQNPVVLPYAGDVAPSVDKYVVTWDGGAAGYHYLEVIVLEDGSGNLSNVAIRNVFTEGFNRDMYAFQPATWLEVDIAEIDSGIYALYDKADQADAPMIEFPGFELVTHDGTFKYIDPFHPTSPNMEQTMNYHAEKVN